MCGWITQTVVKFLRHRNKIVCFPFRGCPLKTAFLLSGEENYVHVTSKMSYAFHKELRAKNDKYSLGATEKLNK